MDWNNGGREILNDEDTLNLLNLYKCYKWTVLCVIKGKKLIQPRFDCENDQITIFLEDSGFDETYIEDGELSMMIL